MNPLKTPLAILGQFSEGIYLAIDQEKRYYLALFHHYSQFLFILPYLYRVERCPKIHSLGQALVHHD